MKNDRRIIWIGAAAMAAALVLLAAFWAAGRYGILEALPDLYASSDGWFTAADLDGAWDSVGITRVDLSESHGETWSGGYWSGEGDLYIVRPGRYALTGTLENGSVVISAGGNDQVWLLLEGVSVHREDSAALRVEKAGKVFLTLADGTENSFTDGGRYRSTDTESGVDGVIYARDDLTINGPGALSVTSVAGHGIVCNDDLILAGGIIDVTAERDGIHAHDSARLTGTSLTVNARNDGISVRNDKQTGILYIQSGTVSIPTCYEGLEAVKVLIDGGDIDIHPRDDGINAPGWGAADDIRVQGGSVRIINRSGRDADGFDSNGDVHITGGDIRISVPNDGSSNGIDFGAESAGELKIDGGTLIACGSSGMADRASPSSGQPSMLVNFRPYAAGGSSVRLLNATGEAILSWDEVPLAFNSVLISSPDIEWGETYTLDIGGLRREVTAPSRLGTSDTGDTDPDPDTPSIGGGNDSSGPVSIGADTWANLALLVSILLAGSAAAYVVGGQKKDKYYYTKRL